MDKVKKSLQQFSNLVSDEQLVDELRHMKRTTTSDDHSTLDKPVVFSQRATDFLEKYELRKYNQLVELSAIKSK